MDRPVNILVLAGLLCGGEINITFIGELAEKSKLGESRIHNTYVSYGDELPYGENFDLIIADIYTFNGETNVERVRQAHKLFPDTKIILLDSGTDLSRNEFFALAKELNAQIEFEIWELGIKIRKFFFPEDFKDVKETA